MRPQHSRLYLASTIFMLWVVAVHAQPAPFACPKAGTIEQRGLGKLTYTGTAPDDPYVCNYLDYQNRPRSLLFNFYGLMDASNATVRAAMLDILSGKKTNVSFDYTSQLYLFHHSWTVLRREPLVIDGKKFDTIVLDEESEQVNGAQLHAHFMRWLDPRNGLWLKSRFRHVSGQVAGGVGSYEDVSITIP